MKITLHYCVIDGGDGSVGVTFFRTQAGAERREKHEEGHSGYSLDECVGKFTMEVGPDGKIDANFDNTHETDDYEFVYED